jgi:bacterioferritin-associated ferredoxin
MYICICKSLTAKTINEKIEGGCTNLKMLVKETAAGTNCGCCMDDLKLMLIRHGVEQKGD